MKTLCAFLTVLALCIPIVFAAEAPSESVALTVYNDGNALVREVRSIDVPKGSGEIRFEDVASTIDPTTVKFRSLTDLDGTVVLEQNYEYDLVSADKLLQKYLGKDLEVITKDGTSYTGALMSFDGDQLVLSSGDSGSLSIIARQDNVRDITCTSLPEGLIVKPTLMWLLQSVVGGSQMVEVAYSASGCGWRADYTAVLNEKDTALDLGGWVTLTNNSGKTYNDARLKLIAGEVNRVAPPQAAMRAGGMRAEMAMAAPQFEEKAFAEYHLYTLPRPTTIKDRQIKQIELLSAASVPCDKKFLFDPMRDFRPYWEGPMTDDFSVGEKGKTQVFIIFKNDEKSNLGMPLPAGRIRLFKFDGKDMEFVGEDSIDHTPKDEKLELLMGNAFDIAGERKRTNFTSGRGARWMEESFEITLRNHKKEAVTVNAREHLFRWTNWSIKAQNHDFTKLDAQTIEFPVTLQPDEEQKITYTVRYEW
jgi:hypothetical protein